MHRSTPQRSAPPYEASDSNALLAVTNCHVRYGLVPALRGVNLAIGDGEVTALLGPNGAGKTSILRAISGLIHVSTGTIMFAGERIDGLSPPQIVARGIAHLPEGRDLFPALTVTENLRYGYWPRRRDRSGYRSQLDDMFDIFPRLRERAGQKAGTLSGGEQQMLGIGMALMSRPRLLLVDELSLGLAPLVVAQLFEVLDRVNREGTSILIVEQFVKLALQHSARAYVLTKGEVALSGYSSELRDDPSLGASYLGSEHSTENPSATGHERKTRRS